MGIQIPEFNSPNFSEEKYKDAPNIELGVVERDGVAPDNFYLTTHMPTFYKYEDRWLFPKHNSLNCVAVLENGEIL